MGFIFRRMGRSLTVLIVIGALIMCIPGIVLLSLSSTIYGQPLQETGQIFNTTIGYSNTINLEGYMKPGNNYDIRIEISVSATPANPPNSEITVRMTVSKTGSDIDSLPSMYDFSGINFNSTTLSRTYEFKDDFVAEANANFTFEIIDSVNLTDIYIKIYLHENPRRVLSDIATWVGLILLIPGGLILIGVACVAGRRR